jgi:hypothetical protein
VHLQFFAERKSWQLNEVDGFSAVILYYRVGDWEDF